MSWFTSQKSVLLETVEELSPVAASTGKASGYDIVVARATRRTRTEVRVMDSVQVSVASVCPLFSVNLLVVRRLHHPCDIRTPTAPSAQANTLSGSTYF